MSPIFLILCLVLLVAQLKLPRPYAFAPLLVAACHFQNVPVVEIGGALTITKLVILVGLFRAVREQSLAWSSQKRLDLWVAIWAGVMIFSGFLHDPKDHNPITIRLSQVHNVLGAYLYARAFLRSQDDILRFCKCLAVVLLPLALMVAVEKATTWNLYQTIGGGTEGSQIREGQVRATGPFSHPILLGTFAATSLPLVAILYRQHRRWAIAGAAGCVMVVFCSASSGPIMTLLSGLLALGFWRFRESVGWIRRLAICVIIVLHVVMQAPVWYLLARVNVVGGSTGWHRAELIQKAVDHIGDWWLIGTDYTRHWFPYGVGWSEYHTDITNHYLHMGVTGGLPLMLCFIMILVKAFQLLGWRIRLMRRARDVSEFNLWCAGAALFAHCVTFFSISYFDQSTVTFSLLLGLVPGLCAAKLNSAAARDTTSTGPSLPSSSNATSV
ncbi:MAG: O-antigen ligase family protein [Verrucomicrobia bacterium]|nr:O-antigen ligase family protein [Verrucomicrobiota bacterium]